MKASKTTPYILLLPTLLFLLLFFAYPMISSLQLALRDDAKYLNLRTEPEDNASMVGTLAMQTDVTIVNRERGEETLPNGRTRPVYWYEVEATDVEGETIIGWANQRDLFVESRTESETARVVNGEPVLSWTLNNIKTMMSDFRFKPAIINTLLIIIIVLPLQFILAIIMALLLQSNLRGRTMFLYIYTIPLGISDLAAGLVWVSIFTQRGFLNSFLERLGLIESPFIFIAADNYNWMLTIIVLAELWRATSIVMIIVVSGLQAIPTDYIEAGEVFGASLWQRIRHIILPMLKPSLQVALILRTILAFQVFSVVVAITGGNVFTVLANETYRWYQGGDGGFNNPNVAAAYSGLILIISLGVSMIYLRAVRTQEEALKSA